MFCWLVRELFSVPSGIGPAAGSHLWPHYLADVCTGSFEYLDIFQCSCEFSVRSISFQTGTLFIVIVLSRTVCVSLYCSHVDVGAAL